MIGLPNPYLAGGCALALLAASGGGFVFGVRYCNGQHASADLKALNKALSDKREAEQRIDVLEAAAASRESARQETVREIYRDVPQIITRNRVVYDRTCIDGAGVSVLDRARAAANGSAGVDPDQVAGGSDKPAGDAPHH